MLKKHLKFELALTKTVVQRALFGYYEVVALMLTPELLAEMKGAIERRRMIEGIYVISRDHYEVIVGLIVNAAQACAALVDVRPANTDFPKPLPSEHNSRKFWDSDCPIGIDRRPEADQLRPPIVILDDVRSSDNIGAIMRTAFSLGAKSIIATKTSYSAINCRASRTSMGGLYFFSLWETKDLKETILDLKRRGLTVYATSPRGTVLEAAEDDNWALILGNEADGSSDEVLASASARIRIPQVAGDSLSVSVAAGICLYGLRRSALSSTAYEPSPNDL